MTPYQAWLFTFSLLAVDFQALVLQVKCRGLWLDWQTGLLICGIGTPLNFRWSNSIKEVHHQLTVYSSIEWKTVVAAIGPC